MVKKVKGGDPDSPEWTDENFARAKPARDVLPKKLYDGLVRARGQRGPQKAPTKQLVSLRLDPEILAYFQAQGPKWQSRINAKLREVVEADA